MCAEYFCGVLKAKAERGNKENYSGYLVYIRLSPVRTRSLRKNFTQVYCGLEVYVT